MRARVYALTVLAVAAAVPLATAAINLLFDPQGVFGTGVFGDSKHANERYYRFALYQAAPDYYTGLVFGSSRARSLPLDEVSRRTGQAYASFAVSWGLIEDHLPVLEFILRTKAGTSRPIRDVLLLLDVDRLGEQPRTNQGIQTLMPPGLTGDNVRFWWTNLTTPQPKAWISIAKDVWRGSPDAWQRRPTAASVAALALQQAGAAPAAPDLANAPAPRPTSGRFAAISPPATTGPQPSAVERPSAAGAATDAESQVAPPPMAGPRERILARGGFAQQLGLLRRFVELCQQHGVQLRVATSPLSRARTAQFDPSDLVLARERIAQIVPIWDFTNVGDLSDRADLWGDPGHFKEEIGRMMVARMFEEEAVGAAEPWSQSRRPRTQRSR
jgi:hypothetical protein